jgi:hypothetical protein
MTIALSAGVSASATEAKPAGTSASAWCSSSSAISARSASLRAIVSASWASRVRRVCVKVSPEFSS